MVGRDGFAVRLLALPPLAGFRLGSAALNFV
jgi:hypothetical protein